jgi:hypothetical protein
MGLKEMPKGRKTGGRQRGSLNKVTLARAAEVAASGLTPLEFMLSVLRDPNEDPARRLDAAKSAAPYCHHRLASLEHNVNAGQNPDGGEVVVVVGFGRNGDRLVTPLDDFASKGNGDGSQH